MRNRTHIGQTKCTVRTRQSRRQLLKLRACAASILTQPVQMLALTAGASCVLFSVATHPTDAANTPIYWSSTPGTSAFFTGGNWVGGTAPGSGNDAVFSGTPTTPEPVINLNSQTVGGLIFNTSTGGWTLGVSGSDALTTGADGVSTIGQSSGTNTILANINVNSTQVWAAGTGGTLVMSGAIGGSLGTTLSFGVATTGSGTIVLDGTNTYAGTGGYNFVAGTVQLQGNTSLGSSAVTVTGDNAGTLDLNGVSLNIGALQGSPTITNSNASTPAVFTIGNNNTGAASSAIISGNLMVSKVGTGTEQINGTNTYTGGNNISGGTLRSSTGFGTGPIILGTNVQLLPTAAAASINASSITVNGTGDLYQNNTSQTYGQAVPSAFYGSGYLTTQGSTLSFTGNLTNYTGTLDLEGTNGALNKNTYSFNNTTNIGLPNGTVVIGQNFNSSFGDTLQWSGTSGTSAVVPIGALVSDNTANGTVNFLANATPNSTATFQIGNANTSTAFIGVIQNGGSTDITALQKVGTGTFTITAANTYTGATTIDGGTLDIGQAASLGSNTVAAGLVFGGGTLEYNGSTAVSTTRLFTIGDSNGNAATLQASGTVAAASFNFSNASSVALVNAAPHTLTLTGTNTGTNLFAPVIEDQSSTNLTNLIKSGSGSWTLSGAETYTGGTNVSSGLLNITGSLASGSALTVGAGGAVIYATPSANLGAVSNANTAADSVNFNAATGTVTLASLTGTGNTNFASNATIGGNFAGGTATVAGVAAFSTVSGGTLNLNGPTATVAALNGGSINLGATQLTVTAGGNNSGSISGTGGSLNLSGGMLTLSGNNTFGGATTITGGSLVAGGSNVLSPTSAVNIVGGTLNVAGYNNSIASLTVGSSGTLTLGYGNVLTDTGAASFAGTLNLTGTASSTLPEILATYNSDTGTFGTVTGVPSGDQLVYTANALEINVITGPSGPANLTFNNAGGTGDGVTWDSVQQNFNNGTSVVAYSDNSNTTSGDNVAFTDANNGNYNVSIPAVVHPTSTVVNAAGNYTFSGSGGISGPGGLFKEGTGALTLHTSNSYAGPTNISGGTVTLGNAAALPAGTNLSVNNASLVAGTLGRAYALQVGTLNVSGGTIDLKNNAMIVHNSNLTAVSTLVASGYHDGAWNGPTGIVSSTAASDGSHLTALGVIVNDGNGVSAGGSPLYGSGGTLGGTFAGAIPTDGDVLVKFTYYGDTDLNGSVDGSDYSRIDASYLAEATETTPFSAGVSGWYNGDFNYDGTVDGSDYTLMDNAFNSQGAAIQSQIASPTAELAGSGASSAVPEPTGLLFSGIFALGLLGRRRRANER